MARLIFTVNKTMEKDLKTQAKKRGATLSGLLRLYVTNGLTKDTGKTADEYEITVGGDTRAQQESGGG